MLKGSHTRRFEAGEQGAVAVEFALVLPLLVMLLMGTITGGMAYYQKISLADAVREGARFAATANTATTSDWAGAVKTRTVAASAGELTSAQVCVKTPTGADPCGTGPSTAPTLLPGTCVVRVRAERPVTVDIVLKTWDFTIVQDAYARYERPCS